MLINEAATSLLLIQHHLILMPESFNILLSDILIRKPETMPIYCFTDWNSISRSIPWNKICAVCKQRKKFAVPEKKIVSMLITRLCLSFHLYHIVNLPHCIYLMISKKSTCSLVYPVVTLSLSCVVRSKKHISSINYIAQIGEVTVHIWLWNIRNFANRTIDVFDYKTAK